MPGQKQTGLETQARTKLRVNNEAAYLSPQRVRVSQVGKSDLPSEMLPGS